MKLDIKNPAGLINKAYSLQAIPEQDFQAFCGNLAKCIESLREGDREDHQKDHIRDFLKDTWYAKTNMVATQGNGNIDLVIYAGLYALDPVSVIIETKKCTNKSEMMTRDKPNAKAFQEIMLYYLQQVDGGNHSVQHLIVTNTSEWFVFDGVWFEKNIGHNTDLMKECRALKTQKRDTRHFYDVARTWLEKLESPIPCCHFNLTEYHQLAQKSDRSKSEQEKLIALYKFLSPQHLLKLPFANDSNSLNREFYNELLHIIGLEEVKDKGKKLIRRPSAERRNEGSLLENSINMLKVNQSLESVRNLREHGASEEEQYFSIALELCITWLNRILFLKLLEGRLIAWNGKDSAFAFLNKERIKDFDDLQELFFEVLARTQEDRTTDIRGKFGNIPYLNSSLFEATPLERSALQISSLKHRLTIPLFPSTVLKQDGAGKRRTGESATLFYLLEFLEAYDFASEGKKLVKSASKTIINASVLGLIFEKLNGYRDGSFYTPGFITTYICRETIRRAVLRKFNEKYGWDCVDFTALHNRIDRIKIKEANEVVNSLKICDPAVGSGHFLVSALNEIIAIKAELKILAVDASDMRLRGYEVSIENDELIVTGDGELFQYNPKSKESQTVQKTLFHEKATIIENCLFGVDINPKSVAICRLRLWIELLKNAYYREGTHLETLPNIDINIKNGNSLVSRFSLNDDSSGLAHYKPVERKQLKGLTKRYREKVWQYKLGPRNKGIIRSEIEAIKEEWRSFSLPNDDFVKSLRNVKNELEQTVFAFDITEHKKREELHKRADELEKIIAERQQTVYANAFEWRFEFPEVLDEDGCFYGFDCVIGNPPYGVSMSKELKERYVTFTLRGESYVLFVELALEIMRENGEFSYIIPDTYLNLSFTSVLREHLLHQSKLREIVLLPTQVFEDATVDTTLLFLQKAAYTRSFHESQITVKLFDKQAKQIDLDRPESIRTVETALWHQTGTFNVQSNEGETTLLERISTGRQTIGTIADLFSGIKVYEVGKGKPPQTVQIRDSKPFTAVKRPDSNFLPFYDGKHIGRYELTWKQNNWIHYGPWLAAPRKPENFIGEKILIRKIVADTLIATYIQETSYCNTLLHVLKIKEAYNLSYKFLLGVLNSRFIGWYFRKKFQISPDDTFPQIMISDIQQLPIPAATAEQQADINEKVEIILAAPEDPGVPKRKEEIDALVYQLYNLTENEIAIVEGR